MSSDVSPGGLGLEAQLLSIMEVLVKAAVTEISQLVSESSASLRLHLSQSLRDNQALRTRMKVMRGELFSLRLQTRTTRPASRFALGRGNTPKPRAKSQVLMKPSVDQQTSVEAVSVSLQPVVSSSSSQLQQEESPDVILIKDEDDVGGCEPAAGQDDFGNHSLQGGAATGTQDLVSAGSSCPTENNLELRIVSVHGRGEGPLQEESSLFSASELQAFRSLSPDHSIAHDGIMNFNSGAKDRALMRGLQDTAVGLARNSLTERNHSTQMTSSALNPALTVGADGHVGHTSHVGHFPHGINKSLDCSFCGEHFLSREELIVHRAAHTGESPLPCSFCGKSFVSKTTLGIHMRIHTGEKPYACMQCGKRFTQNGSLKIHLRTHSGEKPYTCNQCTASFNNPSNLRRHMITHGPNDTILQ